MVLVLLAKFLLVPVFLVTVILVKYLLVTVLLVSLIGINPRVPILRLFTHRPKLCKPPRASVVKDLGFPQCNTEARREMFRIA